MALGGCEGCEGVWVWGFERWASEDALLLIRVVGFCFVGLLAALCVYFHASEDWRGGDGGDDCM